MQAFVLSLLLTAASPIPPVDCNAPRSADNIGQIVLFLWNNCQASWPRDQSIRNTSNPNGTAVHGWIQITYDPAVFKWMHDRKTQIPDGSLIIKQQFDGDDPSKPTGWILMVKDQKASFDGWWWGFVSPVPSGSGGCQIDQPAGCANGQIFDPNCVGCHGSANNRQLTFSSLEHIAPTTKKAAPLVRKEGIVAPRRSLHVEKLARRLAADRRTPDAKKVSPGGRAPAPVEVLPSQTFDKVVSPPGGPVMPGFVSSNVCSGCHDAANLEFCETSEGCTTPWPEMSLPYRDANNPAIQRVNLSPWSEWSVSLMGLSGRDPVFQAQRESETKLHPELSDYIDNLCYHCHAVMGERTLAQHSPRDYTHGVFLTTSGADAKVGGLGRDGVSCTVCHRISDKNLGTEASYTGNFELMPPEVINGPYEQPKSYVMTNSIGMTPRHNKVIQDSALCGSCHIVETPILMPGRKYTPEEAERAPKSHEQTTFFEWRNSAYRTTKSCQSCHMPQTFGSATPLRFKIANIEDDTYTDFPNTTGESAITLTGRRPYSRHTFFGANPFVLELFRLDIAKNNPPLTGFDDVDPNYADPSQWVDRFDLAIDEELRFARTAASIQVSIEKGKNFEVEVRVFNLAGHKLPSGVGFRRAFIEFSVLDAGGKLLWASGRTDPTGLIVDLAGQPLPTELSETEFEPYHAVIDSDLAVQIYEERYFDGAKKLSTSFLAIQDIVKDSRLLPRGWSKKGPDAARTKPIGEVGATYFNGSGSDRVLYRVPAEAAQNAVKVVAALNYQALPPYYVRDRLRDGRGGASTAAFEQLLRQSANFAGTPMAGNKIELTRAEATVGKPTKKATPKQ